MSSFRICARRIAPAFLLFLLLFASESAKAQPVNDVNPESSLETRGLGEIFAICAPLVADFQQGAEETSETEFLRESCTDIVDGSLGAAQGDGVRGLLQDEYLLNTGASTQEAFTVIDLLSLRLFALRDGASGSVMLAGVSDSEGNTLDGRYDLGDILGEDAAAGAGPAKWYEGKLGAFFNGVGSFGDRNTSDEVRGFKAHGGGFFTGFDWRITEQLVAGIAWNYLHTDVDIRRNGGDLDVNTFGTSLYATFGGQNYYVDTILTYSRRWIEFDRKIIYPALNGGAPVDERADGDTHSDDVAWSLGGGYEFTVLEGLTFGPSGRLDVVWVDVDGFAENGASGLDLEYDGVDILSVTSQIGGEAAYPISTGQGVFTPQMRIFYVHEFEADSRNIDARFTADTDPTGANGTVTINTDSPDRNYAELGVGVSATLPNNLSAFVDYEVVLGLDRIDQHLFTAGGRIEF